MVSEIRETLNVAIVGAGLMGCWHAQYALSSGANIVAVIDTNLSNANKLIKKIKQGKAYADIDSMLLEVVPDVIHICVPVGNHLELAVRSIEAGLHVLMEKPLVITSAEAIKIHKLAENNNILICPVHQFCFQNGVTQVVNQLQNFGKPLRIDFNITSAGANSKSQLNEVIEDILPHPLSILRQLWPEQSFNCHNWVVRQVNDGELVILGEYNNIILNIYISMSARPTICQFSIQSTVGTLHVNLFHDYLVKEFGGVSKIKKITQPIFLSFKMFSTSVINLIKRIFIRQPAYPGLQTLIEEFYFAVMGRKVIPINSTDSIDVSKARDELISMMSDK
ncbi:Gfo/Idh/MocA family protein [Cycloclasticus zancles]|jgi:predicted dehydrogenase|uniref:Oxidoreductase n=1 Tax=Cycloclasticus zancles 78-ME TaxID=1198232 RepID=S5TXD0_9GAMM|nr:Gfo/Idh/MocA family oxidoreductase [Cycloclasticus zancles]AGS39780.1 Oxidoreductase [Cycloclasticus zancles 78-ME]